MKKLIGKLFGGLELTWPKLIAAAVAAGVWTAVMAILPAVHYTSFHAIVVTFEAWVLFGIIIIMNSRSNLDAALKCFVFFLVSQPLVYLIQVPFSAMGWGLFIYYRYWFLWTLLCFPMGYIGYYMKKGKWWGYLILLPMIVLTAYSYWTYFSHFLFSSPRYVLSALFCIAMMLLYPLAVFEDRKIRAAATAVSTLFIVVITALVLSRPPVYSTDIMANGDTYTFDGSYTAYLEDSRYGDVEIRYWEMFDDYILHADFRHAGRTVLTLESPAGEKTQYDLLIEEDTFRVTER